MTKQTRKYIIYVLILVVFSVAAIYFTLKDDAEAIFNSIASADYKYLLLGLLMVLISYSLNGLFLMFLTRIYNKKYKFGQSVANHLIGKFFSGITPSASGGQFVQAYTFTKQGVAVSNAASILFMAFIIHQSVAILFSTITFPLKFQQMMAFTQTINILGFEFNLIMLSAVGFVINIFVLLGLFFLAFSKKLHHLLVYGGIGLLKKLKIFSEEKAEKTRNDIETKVATFRVELKRLLTNWKVLLITIILAFLDMAVNNSFPYVMGLAVGAPMSGDIIDGICMSNYVGLITMMIPIPGAAGGAELVFQFMFSTFLGTSANYVNSINLLWRFFTFYLPVFIGALVFFFYGASPKKDVIKIDNDMKSISILSLTQEINFNIQNVDKIITEPTGKRKSKKYRPRIIDEQITEISEEIDVEERMRLLKQELQPMLDENEKKFDLESSLNKGDEEK